MSRHFWKFLVGHGTSRNSKSLEVRRRGLLCVILGLSFSDRAHMCMEVFILADMSFGELVFSSEGMNDMGLA